MNTQVLHEQMQASASRYDKRTTQRTASNKECQKDIGTTRHWARIDSRERLVRRLQSKGMVNEARAVEKWQEGDDPLGFDPYERIIEDNELTSSTTLYEGAAKTHSVGRIVIRSGNGRIAGFGTGFLVSPRMLLTNNHVLATLGEARPSTVEFFYWEDANGREGEKVEFQLDPATFFETDEALDFTLVAVKDNSRAPKLSSLGWSPLIGESGKAAVGESVNIIQHPRGGNQKVVLRQNKIVDVVDDFLHYEADTQRGSSGSPVFNVDWELAALHHSGVPKRDENNRILLRGDVVWNGDDAFIDQIQWIANEGVRISRIVARLRSRSDHWNASEAALFEGCFTPAPHFSRILPGAGVGRLASERDEGASTTSAAPGIDSKSLVTALRKLLGLPAHSSQGELIGLEAIDRDYTNREGYQQSFLGSGRFRLPMPHLRDGSAEQEGTVLDYHNFTVAMNPERRLARFTASNIRGRQLHRIARRDGQTRWVFDTRIPESEQIGNDLYRVNPIDRGHLVRRLDASWGESRDAAMGGNNDTFHYTNSAPQHKDFNEDDDSWAGLEDHYLDNAEAFDRRITVFTGPVFRDNDPLFESPDGESARIPRQYWKVIAYRCGGQLVADGYLLSQREILRDDMGLERFGGDQFATFQVPIARIQDLTDLEFGELANGDTFGHEFDESVVLERIGQAREARPIRTLEDIRLGVSGHQPARGELETS